MVFFKGCPLRCIWCDNPESQRKQPEIFFFEENCTKCGRCLASCPHGAVAADFRISREKCKGCGECAKCYYGAKKSVGWYANVTDVLAEVTKDSPFYRRSGGGGTLGGGECMMQPEFARNILRRCREQGIHTAIETCGCASWEDFEKVLEYTDLVLYDLKIFDSKKHLEFTGMPNELILENCKRISLLSRVSMTIRIPIVLGCTDSKENITCLARFISRETGHDRKVELLAYHRLGESKYKMLDRRYELEHIELPTKEHMRDLRKVLTLHGLDAKIVGDCA